MTAPAAVLPPRRVEPHGALAPLVVCGGALAVIGAVVVFVGPIPGLAVAAASSGLLMMMFRARIATLVFFFLFYGNVLVVASQYHGIPAQIASLAVCLLLLPLARLLLIERRPVVITATLPLLLLYLAAMCASSAASTATGSSLTLVVQFIVEGLLLYLLVSNIARDVDTLTAIVWVLVVACVLMSLLVMFQEFTKSYDDDYFGFAQVSEGGFNVAEDSTTKELRPRLTGPIGEQNRFAQVLVVVVPLAYFVAKGSGRRVVRIAGTVCALVIVSGVLLTFSRGAAVAAFGLLFLAVLHRFLSLRRLLLVLLVLFGAISVVAPDYLIRLASLGNVDKATDASSREADAAIRGRTAETLAAWNTFTDHPLLGVGPGRFFREYSRLEANKLGIRHLDTDRRAHNLYAEMAADQGLLGVGTFLAANGVTISMLIRMRRRWRGLDHRREMMAAGFLFALYAYLLTALFLQLAYQRYYWMLLGLANAAVWVLRDRHGEVSPRSEMAVAT